MVLATGDYRTKLNRNVLNSHQLISPECGYGDDPTTRFKRTGERLREGVHLIVVPPSRKSAELTSECLEPQRVARQKHRTSFNPSRLVVHSHSLVAHGIDRNSVNVPPFEILN